MWNHIWNFCQSKFVKTLEFHICETEISWVKTLQFQMLFRCEITYEIFVYGWCFNMNISTNFIQSMYTSKIFVHELILVLVIAQAIKRDHLNHFIWESLWVKWNVKEWTINTEWKMAEKLNRERKDLTNNNLTYK